MAIEEKKVLVYGCDGCEKKVVLPDADSTPPGFLGTVTVDGAEHDWYAHRAPCVRKAVETVRDKALVTTDA